MGVGTKKPVWIYSTEPAALAAASPPTAHKKGLGLPLHLPTLPLPALPCGNASPLHCMEMLSERTGRWPGRSWSCAPQESTSWGDKNISQGGATALSGYLQGDKSQSEMTVATSLPLFAQSLVHARAVGQARDVAGVNASFGKLLARVK